MTQKNKKSRKFNLRLISRQRSYNFYEIAELLDRSHHTITQWHTQNGMQTIDDKRPYLVHGTELYRYCKKINESFDKPATIDSVYCFGCKAGTNPKNRILHLHDEENRLKITGECSVCGTRLSSFISAVRLERFSEIFTILQSDRMNRIECDNPDYNPQLKEEVKNEAI